MNIEKIFTFKLVTGDEVIAEVIAESDTDYRISNPSTVIISPQGAQMVPSLITGETGEIKLGKSAVVLESPTREDVKTGYIEAVTGIKTQPKQIITG